MAVVGRRGRCMDSVFGDWYEDRGSVVSRSVDGPVVESKDHERAGVDGSRAMRSGEWDQERWGAMAEVV